MKHVRPYLALCAMVLLISCDEELPPQNNPKGLFTVSASVQYKYISETRPTQSYLEVFLVYKNLYDETLEDVAELKGTIRIEWLASPEERGAITPVRTDALTMDNLFTAEGFQFSSNRLSIDPGDSIVLRYRWDLKTDDSTSLFNQVRYALDRGCLVSLCAGDVGFRSVSTRQHFSVTSAFTVFQRSGMVTMEPISFSACWIKPNCGELGVCDQPNPLNPCNILP